MAAVDPFVIKREAPMPPAEYERRFRTLIVSYKVLRALSKRFAIMEGQGHKNGTLQVTIEDANKVQSISMVQKAHLTAYSKMMTVAADMLISEYKKTYAAIGKAEPTIKEKQRFRNGTLYNRRFNAFFYNIAVSGGLGSELSGRPVETSPLAEFIFARPADQDGQAPPDQPLAGVASPNLLITIVNIIGNAAKLYEYSIFNHLPGQFNPAKPGDGLLPNPPRNKSIGDEFLNKSRRGLPAGTAAILAPEFAALEQASLEKVRDNYSISRMPGDRTKSAKGPVEAIVFVTTVGDVVTRRAGNYLALLNPKTKPAKIWAVLDGAGNPQVKNPTPVAGQEVRIERVPITKENILNRTLPLDSHDFGYVVLIDGQSVIEMPNTVAPPLGALTKLETGTEGFNREVAIRAAAPQFQAVFNPYAAAAQQLGKTAGELFYERHFAEPSKQVVAIYEAVIGQQYAQYYAQKYDQYQAKGKKPPKIIVDLTTAFRDVATAIVQQIPEAAALAPALNSGQYEAVVRAYDPAAWMGMKLQAAQSYLSRVLRDKSDEVERKQKAEAGLRSGKVLF